MAPSRGGCEEGMGGGWEEAENISIYLMAPSRGGCEEGMGGGWEEEENI
jgi:hypothetical protein